MVLKVAQHNHNRQVSLLLNDYMILDGYSICVTHLSLSALFLMDLSWLMALLFSIDILAWLARISLLDLKL